MASTAEELASQADQLQTTISFFKIDGMDRTDRRIFHEVQKKALPAHKVQIAHVAPKAAAAGKGVKLDLGHAGKAKGDGRDSEFEKF